jgi:hypothetical protein
MSVDAAGQDILSILRMFTSPRMGPFDNTNAPSPAPPEPNSDAARAISDPARYGGGDQAAAVAVDPQAGKRPPAPAAPPPPAPPVPVGRRVLPDVAATGSVGGSPPTASAAAPAGSADWLSGNPVAQQWFRQVQEAKAEAARQQSFDLIGGGIADLSGGKYAAGGPGGGGVSPSGIRGDLSVEQLQKFYDADVGAKARLRLNQTVDQILKENPGMSRAAVEAMVETDPKKFGELGFKLADPQSRGQAAKELEEARKGAEFRQIVTNPDKAQELMKAAGVGSLTELQALHAAGKLDEVLGNSAQGTPLYQEWLKTDRMVPFTEYARRERVSKSTQPAPDKELADAQIKSTMGKVEDARASRNQMTKTQEVYRMVTDPNVNIWQGAAWGDPRVQKSIQGIADAFGWGKELEGVTNSQQLASKMHELIAGKGGLKAIFGGQPSEGERAAFEKLIGADPTLNREAVEEIVRGSMRRQVQAQLDAINSAKETNELMPGNPMTQAYTARAIKELQENLPDMRTELFPPGTADALVKQNTLAPDDKARTALKRSFDKQFGAGWADYVISQSEAAYAPTP